MNKEPQQNPKKAEGDKKAPMDLIPYRVTQRVAWVMKAGADKYGRYNFRYSKIQASTYYASTIRHIGAWFEGEDLDPDDKRHHIDHAIAGLLVLRDAMIGGNYSDDRPEKNLESLVKTSEAYTYEQQARASQANTHPPKTLY